MRHTSLDFALTSFYFTTTGHVAVVIYHISISQSNQINQSISRRRRRRCHISYISQSFNQINQSSLPLPLINHIPTKTSQPSPTLALSYLSPYQSIIILIKQRRCHYHINIAIKSNNSVVIIIHYQIINQSVKSNSYYCHYQSNN